MQKIFLIAASISGALAVMIGAFGAHALRATLEAAGRTETFETAVKYQFYHSLALLAAGIICSFYQSRLLDYAGYCFIGGILIFCGSLYILILSGVTKWGAVTPIGGLLFIAGWILMCISFFKMQG
ncbi:DUF423 domain-containing protein [Cytophagaceae bacterium ABcell3]|nr:DUF423 domain-containing protein [Cytophagaceae bacterium ABcell3]